MRNHCKKFLKRVKCTSLDQNSGLIQTALAEATKYRHQNCRSYRKRIVTRILVDTHLVFGFQSLFSALTMRRWLYVFSVLVFLSLFSAFFNTFLFIPPDTTDATQLKKTEVETSITEIPPSLGAPEENSIDPTLYIYRGYIDKRSGKTRIVVLSLNECLAIGYTISGIVLGNRISLMSTMKTGRCPVQFAPKCRYNAHIFQSTNNLESMELKDGTELTLELDADRTFTLQLHVVAPQDDGALTVCVPPLYWYTDWPQLIVFLESWLAHGAKHFIFYSNSASEQVYRVLKFYEKLGFVTLIPWPRFPMSEEFDPNNSTYRLGHLVSHTDCLLRIKTQYGALVDVDELLAPRNSSLIEFLSEKLSGTQCGALSFYHSAIMFQPSLSNGYNTISSKDMDFNGVLNTVEYRLKGPNKSAFTVKDVERIATHTIPDLYRRKRLCMVKSTSAQLFHNRYNYYNNGNASTISGKPKPVEFLPPGTNMTEFRETLESRKNDIFPDEVKYSVEAQRRTGKCLENWRKSCKTPIESCSATLLPLENWHMTPYSEEFGFHPL